MITCICTGRDRSLNVLNGRGAKDEEDYLLESSTCDLIWTNHGKRHVAVLDLAPMLRMWLDRQDSRPKFFE